MIKTDCFSYRDNRGKYCDCLEELVCKRGDCNFYKTRVEFWEAFNAANKYNNKHNIMQKTKKINT